jgi:hypothetical protein
LAVHSDSARLGDHDYQQLIRDGFVHLDSLLEPAQLEEMRAVFDDAWMAGDTISEGIRCWILAWEPFRAVLRSPPLLSILEVLFQGQAQLLDYYPNYQASMNPMAAGPDEQAPALRDWHRDFTFVRDPDGLPLMITVLMFIDDIYAEMGPTLVLPGTHRVPAAVVPRHDQSPRPDEQPLPVRAGQALVLNSAIIHSRGLNRSDHPRRGIVLNFGYWWMKPWDADLPLPEDLRNGMPTDLEYLLGLSCPADNLYLFSAI